MITLPGFDVGEKLWETPDLVAYSGTACATSERVLLKTGRAALTGGDDVDLLRREQAALAQLHGAPLHRCHRILAEDHRTWGVFDDFDGLPLTQVLEGGQLSLTARLSIIAAAATLLDHVHARRWVHGELTTASLLVAPGSRSVQLADLGHVAGPGLAPRLRNAPPRPPELLFASPERIYSPDGSIGCQGDIYSLGVLLYRLLYGRAPFQFDDPAQLERAHKTLPPPEPEGEGARVPRQLWSIVQTCLEKHPSDRYQGASGLAADLERCIDELTNLGRCSPFPVRSRDVPSQLTISRRFYGRQEALDALAHAHRAAEGGASQIVLVGGPSGIGKTALIEHFASVHALARERFVSAKHDEAARGTPYSALIRILRSLTAPALAAPEPDRARWLQRLDEALDGNAGVIGAVLPEFNLPEPVALPTRESLNRFHATVIGTIRHLAAHASPLTLFIDDIQWIDSASHALLTELIARARCGPLMLIAAYRTEQEHRSTALAELIEAGDRAGAVHLMLPALDARSLTHLLADTLHCETDSVRTLARTLERKTENNPFFVSRMLGDLHASGVLAYDPMQSRWRWDDRRVADAAIAPNVVDLVVARLRNYPPEVGDSLNALACLGGVVSDTTLALLVDSSPETVRSWLRRPELDGVVLAEGTSSADGSREIRYRFSHDKVQEAAHALLDDDLRRARHQAFGERLLSAGIPEDDEIFRITAQFDRCMETHADITEPASVVRLYLAAAQRARGNNAHASALRCYRTAEQLSDSTWWRSDYALMSTLYREMGETEYALGHRERAENVLNRALRHCSSEDEEVRLTVMLIDHYTTTDPPRYETAIRLGRDLLGELGIERHLGAALPKQCDDAMLDAELERVAHYEPRECALQLESMREPDDPRLTNAMLVLMSLIPASYFSDRKLNALIATLMVRLTFEQKFICAATPKGLSNFGGALAEERGRLAEGHAFARVALDLARERYEEMVPRIMFPLAASLNHWVAPLGNSLSDIEEGIRASDRFGERDYNGYLRTLAWCQNGFYLGGPLSTLLEWACSSLDFLDSAPNALGREVALAARGAVMELVDTEDQERSSDADLHGPGLETDLARCICAVMTAHNAYFLGDQGRARNAIREAVAYADSLSTDMSRPMMTVFGSLVALESLRLGDQPAEERAAVLERAASDLHALETWAADCPHNFEHCAHLVGGMILEVNGDPFGALKSYRRSASGAAVHGFQQFAGLAYELAGRLWLTEGEQSYARENLHAAVRSYRRWGATAVVRRLQAQHAEVLGAERGEQVPVHTVDRDRRQGLSVRALVSVLDGATTGPEIARRALEQLATLTGTEHCAVFMTSTGHPVEVARFTTSPVQGRAVEPDAGDVGTPLALVERAAISGEVERSRGSAGEGDATVLVPVTSESGVSAIALLANHGSGVELPPERIAAVRLLTLLACSDEAHRRGLCLGRKLHKVRSFLPAHVLDAVLSREDVDSAVVDREEIAIMFIDLRGFTAFSSSTEPEECRDLLTQYRGAMGQVFARHGATVDHWAGDGCMVFLRGEAEPGEQIRRVVALALETRERAGSLVREWRAEGHSLGIGIGAAYGYTDVGILGCPGRWDFSASGRYVSLAARLCDDAANGQILVPERIHSVAGARHVTDFVAEREIRGFINPRRIYNIVS